MKAIKDFVAVVGVIAVVFVGLWMLVSVLIPLVIAVVGMIAGALFGAV